MLKSDHLVKHKVKLRKSDHLTKHKVKFRKSDQLVKHMIDSGEETKQDSMVRKSKCYENIDTLYPMKLGGGDYAHPPITLKNTE